MNKDLEALRASGRRLRADLMATNMALQCVLTCLTPEQQRQALVALAELSVLQEQFAEKQPSQEARDTMQEVRAAVERVYSGLQGAHKIRMAKLQHKPDA